MDGQAYVSEKKFTKKPGKISPVKNMKHGRNNMKDKKYGSSMENKSKAGQWVDHQKAKKEAISGFSRGDNSRSGKEVGIRKGKLC